MSYIQKKVNHFIDDEDLELSEEKAIIDSDFRKIVLTHIIANYNTKLRMPLYLSIYGAPGEGKTFQTLQICREHGIKICYFSGAELSGNYERDSILDIEENYKRACNYYYGNDHIPCVVVIDDFHLSPASVREGVGTTVNSQLLTGFLMNLCDKAKNSADYRIPVILLGNTFENIYEPLKRDGRMDFYHWQASRELKCRIIVNLFSGIIKKEDEEKLQDFADTYADKAISFFAEIKNDIEKREIRKYIDHKGQKKMSEYIKGYTDFLNQKIGLDDIDSMAKERIASSKNSAR